MKIQHSIVLNELELISMINWKLVQLGSDQAKHFDGSNKVESIIPLTDGNSFTITIALKPE